MNTSQLKSYAPGARRAFIAAVTGQANRLGITAKGCEPGTVQGDVLVVAGQAFPASVQEAREKLIKQVKSQGFDAVMETGAYTWFNRLVAIRYMELQGHLDHGYRVLSHPEGKNRPQILDHATEVDLPGLDRQRVIELKLEGPQDEVLYRLLLIAQCNALHGAMPFLFERIGDETELLLPGNLLQTDSLIRQLVEGIDEEAWGQIEVIGWLYQFYISERKDQVIGKVVASADIPAATQLFTPNWIVKYMVQNSLGAQWLATYPDSPLKGQMDFYIDPAEQSPEVLAQLQAITPSSLDPEALTLISPTLNYQPGDIAKLPAFFDVIDSNYIQENTNNLIEYGQLNCNSYETSWDFQQLPLLIPDNKAETLEKSYQNTRQQWAEMTLEMQQLEEDNNRIFIQAYGLQDELSPDVPLKEITLTCNPYYRYSKEATQPDKTQFPHDPDLETRLRQDTMQELISYAIGCMMGRYSLDKPGLIYAHSENKDFDPSQYSTFPADDDGILPLTDTPWFSDDTPHRLIEFIRILWGNETLETNLNYLAANLNPKKDETSHDTLRRYLCDNFFKDHLQTYKKRPIYWLFSSGKQKAFQCLVYLHRYNQATLSRMRSEYVIPLQGKMAARLETLQSDIQAATSTAHRKRLEKEQAQLLKQNSELLAFDEKLRHYTDLRISLDLDDGVKVNYSKFGDLLAEVKAICSKNEN